MSVFGTEEQIAEPDREVLCQCDKRTIFRVVWNDVAGSIANFSIDIAVAARVWHACMKNKFVLASTADKGLEIAGAFREVSADRRVIEQLPRVFDFPTVSLNFTGVLQIEAGARE